LHYAESPLPVGSTATRVRCGPRGSRRPDRSALVRSNYENAWEHAFDARSVGLWHLIPRGKLFIAGSAQELRLRACAQNSGRATRAAGLIAAGDSWKVVKDPLDWPGPERRRDNRRKRKSSVSRVARQSFPIPVWESGDQEAREIGRVGVTKVRGGGASPSTDTCICLFEGGPGKAQ